MNFISSYDIIVIGAGHAGCEAALASSRMGAKTLLLTIAIDNIGLMSCNPAIGGLGKGNLVKDLDALGGQMAKVIDMSGIQYRVLNKKKGVAVQSSRTQADKNLYRQVMQGVIMEADNLHITQGIVTDILTQSGVVIGVDTACGQRYLGHKVVICGGTFIAGIIYIGSNAIEAGRMYEPSAVALSHSLKGLGFEPIRLKTDTPARLHIDSIDFSGLETHNCDDELIPFSAETDKITLPQITCYITRTNKETHKIVSDNLKNTYFYHKAEGWKGPRYCPSMEDKVTKFPDKDHHNIILEPEGLTAKEVHVNGFSTSIPIEAQIAAYRTIPGLEKCQFTRPAYAIEYNAYPPTGLYPTYETKAIKGLYFAGQMNGTSGYEEAAVQGFMAAVNAVLSLDNKKPLILGRDESYIGVLTDDLVTKGVDEPYRMFSSRGEYRLLLREDNAEYRLINIGKKLGLISDTRYKRFLQDKELIESEEERIATTLIKQTPENTEKLRELGVLVNQSVYATDILKRPEITYNHICSIIGGGLDKRLGNQLEIRIKYSGYIEKQIKEAKRYQNLEGITIPKDFVYDNMPGLRSEFAERLKRVMPETLGQASRIPGVSVAAIAVLDVELSKLKNVSRETK